MTRPATKLVLALGALLLAMQAAARPAPPADELPRAGELRLEGKVSLVHPGRWGFTLDAVSFTLPGGKTGSIKSPKPKLVLIDGAADLRVRGSGRKLALKDLTPGLAVFAIGRDRGTGGPLLARQVAVWDREEAGAYFLDGVTPKGAVTADCRILSPKPGDVIQKDLLAVDVALRSGLDPRSLRVSLHAEGVGGAKPIPAEARAIDAEGNTAPADGYRVYRIDVPLPSREAEWTLRCTLPQGATRVVAAEVKFRRGAARRGGLLVLAIGVSRYRLPVYDLPFAADDARAFAAAFDGQRDGLYAGVQGNTFTPAPGETAAELPRIRAKLADVLGAGPEDTVMVFISGHVFRQGSEIYLALPDVRAASDGLVEAEQTCLPWREVVAALKGSRAHRFLFADACRETSPKGVGGHQLVTSEQLYQATRSPGLLMIGASRGDEPGRDAAALGHSTFAAALLEALGGRANGEDGGVLTLVRLFDYLNRRVPELSGGTQEPRIPFLQDFDPRTPLVRFR